MKKFLVALDGSTASSGVLAYAVELARPESATLVLFRAFHVPPELTLAWPVSDRPLEHTLRAETERYLRDAARRVPSELRTEIEVGVGQPWRAVCTAAQEQHVDLVIVGTHGYGGFDHLLGTTAAKIVNHADRPVLVVRPLPPAA